VSENVLCIGGYRLRLSAPQRQGVEQEVELGIGRVARVEASLVPMPGELRILTVPTGARVRAIAESWEASGTTPFTLREVPAEQFVQVEVTHGGYRSKQRRLKLAAGEVRTLNFGSLVAAAGELLIRLKDKGRGMAAAAVEVKIDGLEASALRAGNTLLLDGLTVGKRRLELVIPSYHAHSSIVTILDQKRTQTEVELIPKPAHVTIEVIGPATGAWSLEIDGKQWLAGRSGDFELPAELEQTLQIKAHGWHVWERKVNLGAAETLTIHAVMEKVRGPIPGHNAMVELPNGVELNLVWISPGEFKMGSPTDENGRFENEGPQTVVRLTKGFWLGKTPLTQMQWQAIMGDNPSKWKAPNLPVENVSWYDAVKFCRKLTEHLKETGSLQDGAVFTLPSEAQWEYAARAGTTTPWCFGNNIRDLNAHAWFTGNCRKRTHPAGSKDPNPWGLYDMCGNVWEWTRSRWKSRCPGHPGGNIVDYEGPESGSYRVIRGGSWSDTAQDMRCAYRFKDAPTYYDNNIGFRPALIMHPVALPRRERKKNRPIAPPCTRVESITVGRLPHAIDLGGAFLEMIRIEPGEFVMGSPGQIRAGGFLGFGGRIMQKAEEGRSDDEGPQTRVHITEDYWLGKVPVTQGQWQAIMGNNPSNRKGANLPVERVSWNDAMAFCRKLTKRERQAGLLPEGYVYTLPSEAQWEYAARAGSTTRWSFGDNERDLAAYAWFGGNSGGRTHPVGQKRANPWGLYDMHGNVWEWTRSWRQDNYPAGRVVNYEGPASGTYRVYRGGSWNSHARFTRSADRGGSEPACRSNTIGFRLALSSVPLIP
jgi:formylglycine-generating enzyme required for sulfatase activity